MKRIFTLLVLFVALGVSTVSAQYSTRNQNETRRYEPGVYQDERGEYRWQTVESRVWIPERRTSGVFGIGSRTIPGHYEVSSSNRVKVYTRDRNSQYGNRQQGSTKTHPHGMPPGQRKKMENNRNSNDQRRDRDSRNSNDERWDRDNRNSNDERWDRDNRNSDDQQWNQNRKNNKKQNKKGKNRDDDDRD